MNDAVAKSPLEFIRRKRECVQKTNVPSDLVCSENHLAIGFRFFDDDVRRLSGRHETTRVDILPGTLSLSGRQTPDICAIVLTIINESIRKEDLNIRELRVPLEGLPFKEVLSCDHLTLNGVLDLCLTRSFSKLGFQSGEKVFFFVDLLPGGVGGAMSSLGDGLEVCLGVAKDLVPEGRDQGR